MAGHIFDNFVLVTSRLTREKHRELERTEIIQPASSKLMVLLPPWHVAPLLWNRLQKQLLKQGYSLLTYQVSENILNADGKHVARSFKIVKDAAIKDIARLHRTGQFKKVDVAGLSLGTVSALYIAVSGVEINRLILVSPSADLAEGIYCGKRTRKIKHKLKDVNKSLDEYRQEMHELTMRKDYTMHVKSVEMLISDADHVIPYELGLELAESLKNKGIKTQIIRRPYRGHYLSFILFCLTGKFPKDKAKPVQ